NRDFLNALSDLLPQKLIAPLVARSGIDPRKKVNAITREERARLLADRVLISGTAAIKGERSNYSTDAVEQAAETMEIMDRLTSKENIPVENCGSQYDLLRVYVKRENDIPAVSDYMQNHYPAAQKHYLVADVCRPELLIEIEGVAHI
ncbi:MAG: hypothetical protein II198_06750, partial [Bacteroidaceae bacterium]|nr:hypothetical protein [Bacteroidaceae bacterium]